MYYNEMKDRKNLENSALDESMFEEAGEDVTGRGRVGIKKMRKNKKRTGYLALTNGVNYYARVSERA